MKLIILRHKAVLCHEAQNLLLLRLRKMVNEGILFLDAQYEAPQIVELNNEDKLDGYKAKFCFVDEPSAFDEIIKENERLKEEKQARQERTIKKVEKALGFNLFEWQKQYIFNNTPYGIEIQHARRAGKTTACALRLCLSDGEPIRATLTPACIAKNDFLRYLGEDAVTYPRSKFFVYELKKIYETLKNAGGIELREIEF